MASLISSRLVTRGALALGLIIRAAAPGASLAQAPASSSPSESKAPSIKVTYEGGQLTIHAYNVTLAEVIGKVSAITGVKIDLPEGAPAERLPVIEAGPGPARQVLADLLSDSAFDYLIQASDGEGNKLVSVMLLLRGKNNGPTAVEAAARPPRGPFARGNAPQEAPPPDPPAAPQPEITTADATAPTPPAQPDQPAAAPAQPDLSTPPAYGQPLQTNIPKTFPVTPPATMDQQTVNTQLLQMYQQRMQQIQQGRTTGNN